jgi:hypothetical protein
MIIHGKISNRGSSGRDLAHAQTVVFFQKSMWEKAVGRRSEERVSFHTSQIRI